ncbi:MAG: hypothetical protein JWQ02_4302 [Capsulimonas sp.]|nr:hypothetical protein [Capsulimonas sp.]
MSSQQTDTSTSNANWGTLVILVWVVLGAFLVGFLIKNGELDANTSGVTYSAPGAPSAEPAPAATDPEIKIETTPPATPIAPTGEAPTATQPPTPTEAPAPSVAPTPAPSTTM